MGAGVNCIGTYIFFGGDIPTWDAHGAAISPSDAQNMDYKQDDGDRWLGNMGRIRGVLPPTWDWSDNCYNLAYTTDECFMFFKL